MCNKILRIIPDFREMPRKKKKAFKKKMENFKKLWIEHQSKPMMLIPIVDSSNLEFIELKTNN